MKRDATDYLPCTFCSELFEYDDLRRHARSCIFKSDENDEDDHRFISGSKTVLDAALLGNASYYTKEYAENVFAPLSRDGVTSVVKSDELILHFGSVIFRKLGPCQSLDVCQRMRQLGRLVNEVKNQCGSPVSLTQCLSGRYFDHVVSAVGALCCVTTGEHGRHSFSNPSIGLKIGYATLKCAHMKKGLALRSGDAVMSSEADAFIALHKAECNDTVSGRALVSLQLRKMNKPTELPSTDDLVKFKDFLNDSIAVCVSKLS